MQEIIFLFVLAFLYVIFAVIQDIRKREVANWLNFSFIIFALVYRLFYSIFSLDLLFFAYGLAGFIFFFILAHIFYYSKIFAGGDAKLLMGLGAVLPHSTFLKSINVLIYFIFLLFLFGALYSLIYSLFLVSKNKKAFSKQFSIQFRKNKGLFYYPLFFTLFFIILFLIAWKVFDVTYLLFLIFPFLLIWLSPFLFFYSKAVEESCMVSSVSPSKLTEGDWLYQDVIIGRKKIRARWSGISLSEIKLLKKAKRKIKIKGGIPFTPSFLIALVLLLWNSPWHFMNIL